MKPIKIEGLTQRQIELLDIMWSLDSNEDLINWTDTLDPDDCREVITLAELVKLEYIEEFLEIEDFTDALEIINQIKDIK